MHRTLSWGREWANLSMIIIISWHHTINFKHKSITLMPKMIIYNKHSTVPRPIKYWFHKKWIRKLSKEKSLLMIWKINTTKKLGSSKKK